MSSRALILTLSLSLVCQVAFAQGGNKTTNALPPSDRWMDALYWDNEKCEGDAYMLVRMPSQDPKAATNGSKTSSAGGCDGKLTACNKLDAKKGMGLAQKSVCQTDLDAEFSVESNQEYLFIDFFPDKNSNCKQAAQMKQRYLADEKCRKSGEAWSKVVCEENSGHILTCRDDKCESDCTKVFDTEFDKCASNGAMTFQLKCGTLYGTSDPETNTSRNSTDTNVAADKIGMSFVTLISGCIAMLI